MDFLGPYNSPSFFRPSRHTWLWRDELLGRALAVNILVLEVAERPGHGERPVDPLDHDAAARVLDPLSLGWIRRLVILMADERSSVEPLYL